MERGLRPLHSARRLARTPARKPRRAPQETSLLAEFSRDLTQAASRVRSIRLVGREGEVERVIQILCRRTKTNPCSRDPRCRRPSRGSRQRISDGDVPPFLADKRIFSLDLSPYRRRTKYRGQFEERLKTIMKELMESQTHPSCLAIDEGCTLSFRPGSSKAWTPPTFSSRALPRRN